MLRILAFITFITINIGNSYSQEWEWVSSSYPTGFQNSIRNLETSNSGQSILTISSKKAFVFGSDTIVPDTIKGSIEVLYFSKEGTPTHHFPINLNVYDLIQSSDGSFFITGMFYDSVKVNNKTYYAAGGEIFLGKIDSLGNFEWFKNYGEQQVPGTNIVTQQSIAKDRSDNIYVVGVLSDSAYFDLDTLYYSNGNLFISKFDKHGTQQWVRQAGNTKRRWSRGYDIHIDKESFVYVTGTISDTCYFGSQTIAVPKNRNNTYLTKLDSSGSFIWTISDGGTIPFTGGGQIGIDNYGTAITSNEDYIFYSGFYMDEVTFGGKTLGKECGSSWCSNFFVACYEKNGVFKWVGSSSKSTYSNSTSDLAVDSCGNVMISGKYRSELEIGARKIKTTKNISGWDIFVAKYNSIGICEGLINADIYSSTNQIEWNPNTHHFVVACNYHSQSGDLEEFGLDSAQTYHSFLALVSDSLNCSTATSISQVETILKTEVFPNPAQTHIIIEQVGYNGLINVDLWDISGKNVKNQQIPNNSKLNVEDIDNGLYILTIRYDDKLLSTKVQICR